MPSNALRNQYVWGVATFGLGGLLVAAYRGVKLSIVVCTFCLVALAFASTVVYWFAKRKVWVGISSEGLRGPGFLGMRTTILWSHSVMLTPISPPSAGSVPGITVMKVDRDGIPTSLGSVFVPRAILQSASFQAALQKHAPAGHPLLVHTLRAA